MQGFVVNIEKATLENDYFRKVLYTDKNDQLVVMSLKPKEEIGKEVHLVDQFIRIEAGEGRAILNGVSYDLEDGSSIIVPAHTEHNIINTSASKPMKLYTLYSPPHHRDGVAHKTKEEAEADKTDIFDGKTTEKK